MEKSDDSTIYEAVFSINNATETQINEELSIALNINTEQANAITEFINLMEPKPELFNIKTEYPEVSPGAIGFMVVVKKYNINVSKIALSALAYLLNFIPVFNVGSATINLMLDINGAISFLTDKEKAMAIFLKKLSYDGKEVLSAVTVRRTFKKYSKVTSNMGIQDDLNSLLDSLDKKGIIEIKTKTIKVLK